jgi:hypothetical protein
MGSWVIFDFLIGGGLIVGLIAATTLRLASANRERPGARRGRGTSRAVLWTLGAALTVLVLFNVAFFRPGANHIVGSPTRAQVTGTWVGDYSTILTLRADGTFTTGGLPAQVGTAAPVLSSASGDVLNVWSGHGTWVIGPGRFNGSPASVIFTVACKAGPAGCTGHPRTFELQMETNAPSGGGGPALFYYLGNSHDLSNQYPFNRSPGPAG